jgi:cytochrome c oxidase subunit 6a
MIVAAVNGKLRWDAHWEHVAHDTPREDKPEYAYQNLRTKNYFWGDGDKVC